VVVWTLSRFLTPPSRAWLRLAQAHAWKIIGPVVSWVLPMCVGASAASVTSTAQPQEKTSEKRWYDPIVVDLGGGVPAASSQQLRFIGAGTAGYVLPSFGAVVQGSLLYYEQSTSSVSSDTTRASAVAEAWYSTGAPTDSLRLQVRATGGAAVYDSTYTPKTPSAGWFHDEDSGVFRGNALVGLEFLGPSLDGYVLGGGGAQVESYDYLATDPHDPNVFSSTTDTSAVFTGRAQVRWTIVRDTLSTRLRTAGSYFTLSRENLSVSNQATQTLQHVKHLELEGRLSVEVDTLAWAGFVPFVYGGLAHVASSSDAESTSVTVPSVGAGVFKPVWY